MCKHPRKADAGHKRLIGTHQRAVVEHSAGQFITACKCAEPEMFITLRYCHDQLRAAVPAASAVCGTKTGNSLELLYSIVIFMIFLRSEYRAERKAGNPAWSRKVFKIKIKLWIDYKTNALKMGKVCRNSYYTADGKAQLYKNIGIAIADKTNLKLGPYLKRGIQVRHVESCSIAAALHRHPTVCADIQMHTVGFKEQTVNAFAVHPKDFTAIDQIRQWQGVKTLLIGPAVIRGGQADDPDSRFPQRQLPP